MERIISGDKEEANLLIDTLQRLLSGVNCKDVLKRVKISTGEAMNGITVGLVFAHYISYHECGSDKTPTLACGLDIYRSGSVTYVKDLATDELLGRQIYPGNCLDDWAKALVRAMELSLQQYAKDFIDQAITAGPDDTGSRGPKCLKNMAIESARLSGRLGAITMSY